MRNIMLAALAATALTASPAMAATTITVTGEVRGLYNGDPYGPQLATFTGVSAQDAPVNNAGTNFFDVYLLEGLKVVSLGNTFIFTGTGFNYYTSASAGYSGFANGINSNVIRFDNETGDFISTDNSTFTLTLNGNPVTANFTGVGDFVASAAVPETATWGMMITGFGMMGAGMRSRRRSTKVSFA
ncbi:hypothetical protein H5J25_04900 [Sphingomonas aliaeris]|uniref:PEP-CTERM sorting domain-containing protein n=1 Tax=Sphingomonas aliaeris TaxID=2759526 RepID=A0A974NWC1_9SPHN|nr:hypothetical protein [Sphingomonas aliaeris]QQV78078.1 hypothetical protein H5J25_04900 [Sphingomonas aliaeris]